MTGKNDGPESKPPVSIWWLPIPFPGARHQSEVIQGLRLWWHKLLVLGSSKPRFKKQRQSQLPDELVPHCDCSNVSTTVPAMYNIHSQTQFSVLLEPPTRSKELLPEKAGQLLVKSLLFTLSFCHSCGISCTLHQNNSCSVSPPASECNPAWISSLKPEHLPAWQVGTPRERI